MSLNRDSVLAAIPSSQPGDFNDLCRGLGADRPEERGEWADLFRMLDACERDGLVEIERTQNMETKRMEIDTLQLTDAGAAIVRANLDKRRGLLGLEGV